MQNNDSNQNKKLDNSDKNSSQSEVLNGVTFLRRKFTKNLNSS